MTPCRTCNSEPRRPNREQCSGCLHRAAIALDARCAQFAHDELANGLDLDASLLPVLIGQGDCKRGLNGLR